jgi:hypothetical protein
MVESGKLPKLVYLGIGTSSATVALYPWLRPGLRAFGDARDLPLVSRCDPKLLSDALPAALFRSYYQWNDCRLIAERMAIGAPLIPPTKLIEDERGWAHWVGDPLHPRPNDVLPMHPAVSQADNPNIPALHRALTALRQAGVPVVLLEMPLPSIAPPHMSLDNPAYRDFLEVVSETVEAPIIRPPEGYITDDDFFDHVHLTVAGAEKYSRWLARHVAETLCETTPCSPQETSTVAAVSTERHAP